MMAEQRLDELPIEKQNEVMQRIWMYAVGKLGKRWISEYGLHNETSANVWRQDLADMTLNEIKAGLEALVNWREAFLPTLPQFRVMCKPPAKPAAHRDYQPDPRPPTDDDRNARFSAMLQAAMAGQGEKPLTMATNDVTDEQRKRWADMAVNGGSKQMRDYYRQVCAKHGIAAPQPKPKPLLPYQAEVWRKCATEAANPTTRAQYAELCRLHGIPLQTPRAAMQAAEAEIAQRARATV